MLAAKTINKDLIKFGKIERFLLKYISQRYTITITMLFILLLFLWGLEMPNVNTLLEIAIKEICNVNTGEIFLLRDLFKGYEWNRISRSDRLLLGTLFLNYINTANIEVTPIEKTSSGQQKYIKSSATLEG